MEAPLEITSTHPLGLSASLGMDGKEHDSVSSVPRHANVPNHLGQDYKQTPHLYTPANDVPMALCIYL